MLFMLVLLKLYFEKWVSGVGGWLRGLF